MNIDVIERLPSIEEYNHLRSQVEWPIIDPILVQKALANTFFGVVAIEKSSNTMVGMGRVIGDDAIYLHIQDVIVHPSYQKAGVGKLIMDRIMEYIESAGGKNTNIGLMCSKGRENFYKGYGFIERPNEKFGAGMIKIK